MNLNNTALKDSIGKFKTNSLENSQTSEIRSHEKLGRYFRKRILADFRVYTTGCFFSENYFKYNAPKKREFSFT